MSKGKFALGTIIGAAVGLVAGILTAPKSGKETRAELKMKGEVLKSDAAKKAEQVQTKASEVVEDVRSKAAGTAQDVKSKTDDLKERTERAVEGARKGFNDDKTDK